MNILWILLKNKNPSYHQPKNKAKTGGMVYIEETPKTKMIRRSKNKLDDMQQLKNLILRHVTHDPPKKLAIFNGNQIKRVIQHVEETYFAHYPLYYHVLNNHEKNEEINITLTVDLPKEI